MQKNTQDTLGFTYTPPKIALPEKPDTERAVFHVKKAKELHTSS